MEEGQTSDNHLTSAAAFVEGGIQDACDDACSICLEEFCDSEPSTLTTCKHEFHLQCILEWCQRSSQCPMCWQAVSLKDPSSQELLDCVEHERNLRMNPPRNTTTIFHHPTLGDFELQHLPISATESELEERIIQHLAAAAAMGRARLARREGQRSRPSAHGRPHYVVFSTHPTGDSATTEAASVALRDGRNLPPSLVIGDANSPFITIREDSGQLHGRPSSAQAEQLMATATGLSVNANQHGTSSTNSSRRSPTQSSPSSQDRAGPSDLQSFSESVKSRLSSFSTRYKESITKSTRGWKERLFARNSSTSEPTGEVRREVDQGVATVTRMMDHLNIAEDGGANVATVSHSSEDSSSGDPTEPQSTRTISSPSFIEAGPRSPCATSSASI